MRMIDADALTDFLKCLLPERGMWEIDGDVGKNAVCETVAEAIEMVKNMETIKPETNCSEIPNNSDLIERQAAIEAVKEYFKFSPLEGRQCAKAIERVPSVQPRRGKWIGYNADDKTWQRDDGTPIFMDCSECHGFVINNTASSWNFCPNCGADMREII